MKIKNLIGESKAAIAPSRNNRAGKQRKNICRKL
jgi:hypothetical protein